MKKFIILIALLFSIICIWATTMIVHTTNGSESFELGEINNITFIPGDFPSDPIAFYPFSGNSNDASGNGNDADVNGATLTPDRFGNANSAYDFDGIDDFIECDEFSQTFTDYSVSAWINANTLPPGGWASYKGVVTIQTKEYGHNAGSKSINLMVTGNTDDEYLRFTLVPSNGSTTFEGINTDSVPFNFINEWVHIVGIRVGGTWKIYINGTLQYSIDTGYTSEISFSDHYIDIGQFNCWHGSWDENHRDNAWWDGKIDDVRIYNRALSESEINSLYHEVVWDQ
ncbi:MAG: LamG domain-containing protein [Candidatus Cloacimonetes bacterium]|nr:LamG domain-containing protein [Candidatus Cloacimonadota bacterium]